MHQPASSKRSFIGRRRELTDICTLLGEPDCRLVTLHGPGGVGKSRLAQQLAGELGDEYPDGIYFVPLQGVEMPSLIVATVADVLQVALRGEDDPRSQLFDRLRTHNCLLILDNLEHLLIPPFLDETQRFIAGVLRATPSVMLLITSREVLNLREEWVFPLRGLPCPVDAEDTDTVSESLQLFADRARQIRADFSLQDDFAGAVRICQLVDGLPLALELAASWTKVLTCRAIADEIERNLAFLAAAQHNVSPRHQSLEAVFEHSWALVTDDERLAMARLAVFRDGFQREVAREVAGIRLPVLASLADKALLQMQPDGRYRFHEHICQLKLF